MKVLVIDDNPAMRRLIRSIVGDFADVIEGQDGSDVLALYEQHRPAWVLMDIRMSKVSGIEATRRIITAHPDARVVIVTDYDDPQLRDSAREAGACDYVIKDDVFSLRLMLKGSTA